MGTAGIRHWWPVVPNPRPSHRIVGIALADLALSGAVLFTGVGGAVSHEFGPQLIGGSWWPRIAAAAGLMLIRTRLPVVCLAGLFLAFPFWQTLARETWPTYQIVALVAASYSVAAHLPRRRALLVGALAGLLWGVAAQVLLPGEGPLTGVANVLVPAIFFILGLAVRRQHDQSDQIASLARRLDAQQELLARAAVLDERASIARELHDTVAHTVSVMVLRAGAVRGLLLPDQGREQAILLDVERSGREAVGELHQMLGMLRDDSAVELAPQPGLARLEDLVTSARTSGLPVELEISGEPVALPAGVDLSAYRIIQEALNNVMRHAASSPTSIHVTFASTRLEICVDDDGTPDDTPPGSLGAGMGILGMRERAALYGGTLDAGPKPQGGFTVHASLPLQSVTR